MRAEKKICRGWHLLPDRRRKAKPSTGGDKSWAAGSPLGRSRSSRRAFEQQIGHEIRAESSNQRRQLLGTESELKKKILLAAWTPRRAGTEGQRKQNEEIGARGRAAEKMNPQREMNFHGALEQESVTTAEIRRRNEKFEKKNESPEQRNQDAWTRPEVEHLWQAGDKEPTGARAGNAQNKNRRWQDPAQNGAHQPEIEERSKKRPGKSKSGQRSLGRPSCRANRADTLTIPKAKPRKSKREKNQNEAAKKKIA
jgi:hypothetical protein